jgi:hypothetical protein
MGTKLNPGKFDCYENALPDEPMFTLLGRDLSAPNRVREWADERKQNIRAHLCPQSDIALVQEARQCADSMANWRAENLGKWRK